VLMFALSAKHFGLDAENLSYAKSVNFLGGTSTFALRAALKLQKSTTYISTTTQGNLII
jgi:hypothetical protein